MNESKRVIRILSVEYIDVKPTLTTTQTNTLIQATIDDEYILKEVARKVEDPEEIKAILLEASKKPPDMFKGLEWEV